MRLRYFLFLIVLSVACQSQQSQHSTRLNSIPEEVPRGREPLTPSREALEEVVKLPFKELVESKTMSKDGRIFRNYAHRDEPFSGWVRQIFPDTDHRFRYMKLDSGVIVWQVGYYADGVLDFDFHGKDGYNYGSQRMWHTDGTLYIDTYFLEGGVQDGPQKRWYGNKILASDALYDKGELVYEVSFDQEGNIEKKKGKVPQKYE